MSILERLYLGSLCPIEEAIPSNEGYRSLSNRISDERKYFEGILSAKDKKRFEKWNMMIFQYEDMREYANFT